MLDLALFRTLEGIAQVKEIQRKRFGSEEIVDDIAKLIERQRKIKHELQETQKRKNEIAAAFKTAKIQKQDLDEHLLIEKESVDTKIKALGTQYDQLDQQIKTLVKSIGNFVHPDVVVEQDEAFNKVIRTWGPDRPAPKNPKQHHELFTLIGGVDMVRGSKLMGHRGYLLINMGVRLNQAIRNYGMDFLMNRGYKLIETPPFMYKDLMAKTAQLSQFDEELYHIEGTDKYLIATSEQPLSCMHSGQIFGEKDLPIFYGGYSICFRREAGAAGRDNAGIFRCHNFEKIEQFVLTTAENSDSLHKQMLKVAEEFYQSLEIPYRVVDIVSGALNNAAIRKFDLEGFFPAFEGICKYRELVSCSNCTDYQSRELDIKYTVPLETKGGKAEKKFVHLLNSTLTANTRTLCAILENYQTETGVEIPTALLPYMGGLKFIPFVVPK